MLAQHISQLINRYFIYEPTNSQQELIKGFGEFLISHDNEDVLMVKGFAGTGKTWIVSALVKALAELGIKTVLMAPTGRAAKVFGTYANQTAYTIHKVIYRQKTSGSEAGAFSLNWNKSRDTIFIIDEASMISNSSFEYSIFGSGRLLDDVLDYIYQGDNCKLIVIGDTAQLPPVGLDQSPALDKELWKLMGYNIIEYFLDEVIRQSAESGILFNATLLREYMSTDVVDMNVPELNVSGYSDIHCISGEELIELISGSFDQYGIENSVVICRSNKRASMYNKGIRNSILMLEEEITSGDYLLVVKNNYFWTEKNKEIEFIANGDIAKIVRINGYEEMYGYRFANVTLSFSDYNFLEIDVKIILDVLSLDTPGFSKAQNDQFYKIVMEDYTDIKSKRKQFEELKKNPYFNALQVKYGYALTCHKSQGGQWNSVFIDQGLVKDEEKNMEYMRWLYTAITRATDNVYLINFPKNQIK